MIDLLEEAIHLLRRSSAIMYAYYILGVTPFALLFFQLLADASYHRYLAEHLGDSVIRLALGYCWMKGFQALACQRLLASYSGEPVPRRGPLELLRLWSAQCAIQPWGILIKPMAFIALVPSPFVDAFFQNASIVMTGNRGDFMRCVQLSTGKIGSGLILNGIIFTFRIVMFACVYSTLATLPFLCKMLLGVETLLTHNFQWLVSVPFLIGAGFVSYFIIDLLQKSFYVIRLRRIDCETSGRDLVYRLAGLGYAIKATREGVQGVARSSRMKQTSNRQTHLGTKQGKSL